MKLLTFLFVLVTCVTNSLSAQTWQEWQQRSKLAVKQYDIGTAANNMEQAVKLFRQSTGGDSGQLDSMEIRLSELYSICMRYEKSVPFLKRIISTNQNNGNKSGEQVHALTNLAAACVFYEQFDSAFTLLGLSERLRIELHPANKFLQAENQIILSRYYTGVNNLNKALECSLEASRLYKLIKDSCLPEMSLAFSFAANISMQLGDLHSADAYIEEFKNLLSSPYQTYHPYFIESYINLAGCLAMKGKLDEANAVYTMYGNLAIMKLGKENPLSITYYNDMGYNQLRLNKFNDAKIKFSRALNELANKGLGNSVMYFKSTSNLGLAYMLNGQFAASDSIFDVTLNLVETNWGRQHNLYITALYNKAIVATILGNLDVAASAFIEASTIYKNQLFTDMSGMSEKAQLNIYNVAEIYFQAIPSFLHLHKQYLNDSVRQALYTEQSFLKGLISSNYQRVLSKVRSSGDSSLTGQLDKWVRTRQAISGSFSAARPRKYTDSLVTEMNMLESWIMSRSQAFTEARKEQMASYETIVSKLKKDETAIEFFKYRLFDQRWIDSTFYAALIIQPGSTAPIFLDLCTDSQLLKIIGPYYPDSLSQNYLHRLYKNPQDRIAGKQYGADLLYRMVWAPLEKYLKNTKTVFVSPMGLLNLITFSALPYQGNRLLPDKYQIHRLQRLSDLVNNETDAPGEVKNIEIWGNIDYGTSNSALPVTRLKNTKPETRSADGIDWIPLTATETEINNIKKIFDARGKKVNLFTKAAATKQNFVTAVYVQPSYLHIATHGFYTKDASGQLASIPEFYSYNVSMPDDPLLRSGLVFAGANLPAKMDSSLTVNKSILTSYDIASLNLSNVRLATLSACETAMGDLRSGEGVFGLQRALKIAGVNKMILTLWPVDDEKTQIFMSQFYSNLVTGSSVWNAFSKTQLQMRKNNEPKNWAGFILIE